MKSRIIESLAKPGVRDYPAAHTHITPVAQTGAAGI
jgi:hypothetical protein